MSTAPPGAALPLTDAVPARRWWPGRASVVAWAPGLLVMGAISGLSFGLAALEEQLIGQALIEALVLALLLGVVARNLLPDAAVRRLTAGANLSAKQILEVGVCLLGASVFFPEILRAGPGLLGLIVAGVVMALVVSFGIGRTLGLGTKLALLVAIGNSICGNSAIAALAPAIGADRKDVASAVGLTAVIGVCLVLALPLLIVPLALSNYQYGVLAGMSVYAVPQVVAAAAPVSPLSLEVATLVKLTRVLLLGPVVLVVGALVRVLTGSIAGQGAPVRNWRSAAIVPWFVAGFLVLAALRSVGVLPDLLAQPSRDVSRLLTVLAMAGLGFGVELAAVRGVGPRVGLAVIGSLAFMTAFTLLCIRLSGLQG
jgi:uncharacterized integral membrane protein (TIGR00698 family)